MQELAFEGVELAPSKVWADPALVPIELVHSYRAFWSKRGLSVIALQALLFNRPELKVFGDDGTTAATKAYLKRIIRLAAELGAKVLVFGSPRQRTIGGLDRAAARRLAVEFFFEVGESAREHGVQFCIEPNPPEYGCDFVTGALEGLELVKEVNNPGFRLHLDAGAMTINGEDYERVLPLCMPYLAHFHVSEPHLEPVGSRLVDHQRVAAALRASGYKHWVSIEMREKPLDAVRRALELVREVYL